MKNRIMNYVRAAFPGLYVVSHEETRVAATVKEAATDLHDVYTTKNVTRTDGKTPLAVTVWDWSLTKGAICVWSKRPTEVGEQIKGTEDPMKALQWVQNQAPEGAIIIMKDFHFMTEGKNPAMVRLIKDTLHQIKGVSKTLVVVGCRLGLLPELEKELTVIDFALPTPEQLKATLRTLNESSGLPKMSVEQETSIQQAASGLTTIEAENAFALSIIEVGEIRKDIVYREKCATIRKNGLLNIIDTNVRMEDIGGLQNLKSWLLHRKDAFTEKARQYRLPIPRGALFVGNPGTGKSLTAQACKTVFDLPLLHLDAGKLYGSLVGQTESNWRTAISLARAMAPCILWIDEVDGATSGGESSGKTDGGTTSRLIKSMLQDIETSPGVFFVMTANDIDSIPSPLLRRMDEVWNVELPSAEERHAIWAIQIAAQGRDPSKFDLDFLAEKSDGYSGFEIRKCVEQGLHLAFPEDRDMITSDIEKVLSEFVPLSQTKADDIIRRRERLKGVAKLAGAPIEAKEKKVNRKLSGFKG